MWEIAEGNLLFMLGSYVLKVVAALVIIAVGIWVARLIRDAVHRALVVRQVEPTLVGFVDSAVIVILYGLVVIEALYKLGIESSTLVAVVGAAGVAVALALRGHLANVAAGLLIILFRPFSIGDRIEGGGATGTVEKIELLATELCTPDNLTVVVPNSKLTTDKVINYSQRGTRRMDIVFGVSYKADLAKVRAVLQDLVAQDDLILEEPQASVTVKELGDSSVKIEVETWVRSQDYARARVRMNEKIKGRFDTEEIPFP